MNIWKKKKLKANTMFLRGKTSKRKHPRVDTITTGKANPLYENDLHTQGYQHNDIHPKISPPNLPSG